jgi:hypothetical protein
MKISTLKDQIVLRDIPSGMIVKTKVKAGKKVVFGDQ